MEDFYSWAESELVAESSPEWMDDSVLSRGTRVKLQMHSCLLLCLLSHSTLKKEKSEAVDPQMHTPALTSRESRS
jgi:hypothetical protein